jgi:non-ribosomal peptide synthetase component F
MAQHFSTLLAAAAMQPHTTVAALPLMEAAEQRLTMHTFNETAVQLPDMCMHQLFEQAAAEYPNANCLTSGLTGDSLTYSQVDAAANLLAHKLVDTGVAANVSVAVLTDKRPELYIALLAVWKAGGCYVPIDHKLPAARVQYIMEQAEAKVLLAESTIPSPAELLGVPTVHIDGGWGQFSSWSVANPGLRCNQADAAYILFTSGQPPMPLLPCLTDKLLTAIFCWCSHYLLFILCCRLHWTAKGRQGAPYWYCQRHA